MSWMLFVTINHFKDPVEDDEVWQRNYILAILMQDYHEESNQDQGIARRIVSWMLLPFDLIYTTWHVVTSSIWCFCKVIYRDIKAVLYAFFSTLLTIYYVIEDLWYIFIYSPILPEFISISISIALLLFFIIVCVWETIMQPIMLPIMLPIIRFGCRKMLWTMFYISTMHYFASTSSTANKDEAKDVQSSWLLGAFEAETPDHQELAVGFMSWTVCPFDPSDWDLFVKPQIRCPSKDQDDEMVSSMAKAPVKPAVLPIVHFVSRSMRRILFFISATHYFGSTTGRIQKWKESEEAVDVQSLWLSAASEAETPADHQELEVGAMWWTIYPFDPSDRDLIVKPWTRCPSEDQDDGIVSPLHLLWLLHCRSRSRSRLVAKAATSVSNVSLFHNR